MIWLLLALALVFGGGLWLLISSVWPAPSSLGSAISRLHTVTVDRAEFVPLGGEDRSSAARLGRWIVGKVKATTLSDERTAADLAVLQRPLELYVGATALAVIAGALAGPTVWAVAEATGTKLPFAMPVWVMLAGAAAGWLLPRVMLRGDADRARSDFRHALGAYLDILVLLLAAQEGTEGAMETAAEAGQGPAFAELRRAVLVARLAGNAVWDSLDDLGRRFRVDELREIASAGSLAGESGAAVRKILTAKARAMRQAGLAEAEAAARRNSQAMFAPLALMGLGFIVFLIYPLVTNLSFGG